MLVERLQHLLPARDGGEDVIGIGGPGEGLWVFIVLGDVAVDGGLEVDKGAEDPALEPAPGERREEALHGVEP